MSKKTTNNKKQGKSKIEKDNFGSFIRNYWIYYRELEDEFIATRKYVDFREDNFKTYSIDFLKLYQAVCSEIDVIGKAMAYQIDRNFKPDDRRNNIYKWWFVIQDSYRVKEQYAGKNSKESLLSEAVENMLGEYEIKPWENFRIEKNKEQKGLKTVNDKGVPRWWYDYNKVKHARTFRHEESDAINYTRANLGNVSKAFAGLYVLEKAYMQKIGTQNELEAFANYSRLFDRVRNATTEDLNKIVKDIWPDQ